MLKAEDARRVGERSKALTEESYRIVETAKETQRTSQELRAELKGSIDNVREARKKLHQAKKPSRATSEK